MKKICFLLSALMLCTVVGCGGGDEPRVVADQAAVVSYIDEFGDQSVEPAEELFEE